MKTEKLIPSLIEEDKTTLPKRGGKYHSLELETKKELEQAKRKLSECNCNCNCDCNCYNRRYDDDRDDCNC